MVLRVSEEEYRALAERQLRKRATGITPKTAPTCCQPARASGITLEGGEEKPRRQKYGNRRVEVDGMKFDSQHEAQVYAELMLRVRAGALKVVLRQVAFDLPGGIRYIADFLTIDHENRVTVYDAKSEITRKNRVYINKKKQMLACCGMEIIEI